MTFHVPPQGTGIPEVWFLGSLSEKTAVTQPEKTPHSQGQTTAQ